MHLLDKKVVAAICLCCSTSLVAQWDTVVYRVKGWPDGALILGTAAVTAAGALTMNAREPLSEEFVLGLYPSHVNFLDRVVFEFDFSDRAAARHNSDIVLGATVLAPLLLPVDRKVRERWQPILALYAEAMLLNTSIQSWTAIVANRYRPAAYVHSLPMDERVDPVNHNSFFSGHTSATATASFFMARVLADLHPEWGSERWLLYAGACVPPMLTGWFRMQAAKHFPTDVLAGLCFGAGVGMLVPSTHLSMKEARLGLLPFLSPQGCGLSANLTWSAPRSPSRW